jgi:large-conductance mechanosensitive channel
LGGEFLKGAVVFVVAFLIFLVITLGYPSLPPGKMIYDAIVRAETTYLVLGIGASVLVAAVFNGVIYGVIIWLVYTLAARMTKKEPKKTESK